MRRLALLLLGVAACGPRRPAPHALQCPGPHGRPRADTIRIALPDAVDPAHAPSPRNESEQLVFRQVYEGACALGELDTLAGGVVVTRSDRAVLHFTWRAGDARDLLDGGADAVLTGQRAALEYAAARQDLARYPLPWGRVYALVLRRGSAMAAYPARDWRDAIRGDGRPPEPPFWWRDAACAAPGDEATTPAPDVAPRVLYRQGDDDARGLAERLVARAGVGSGPRAVGVPVAALVAVADAGDDHVVLALPRTAPDPCGALRELGLGRRHPEKIVPLLDTRLHLIARRGSFGVSVGQDGIPRIEP